MLDEFSDTCGPLGLPHLCCAEREVTGHSEVRAEGQTVKGQVRVLGRVSGFGREEA